VKHWLVVLGWSFATAVSGVMVRPTPADRGLPAVPIFLEVTSRTDRSEHVGDVRRSSSTDVTLALNGMTDERRIEIAHALGALADQVERRHNPLVEDLDEDARPAAERLLREEQPALTAASALAAGRWTAADGSMVVRATTTCAPGTTCLPLNRTDRDGVAGSEAQARFLAWPIACSVILGASPDATDPALAALRATSSNQRIALALGDGDRGGFRYSEGLAELASSAGRIANSDSNDPMVVFLRRLSASGPTAADLSWLSLPRGSILVVPRLGALASIGAFVSEVRARLASARVTVDWLYEPPALP
jgi:hypothetical protein